MERSGSGAGERKGPLIRSLDYLCVRRFRLRRLLAFLWSHSYNGAFESLSKETRVFFRVEHLQHLVRLGLWSDAMNYVFRFVPAFYLPVGGQFLVSFINFLWEIAVYDPTDPSTFPESDPYWPCEDGRQGGVSAGGVKLAQIIRSVCSKQAWGSINWPLVRFKAAQIIGDLVAQIPEFDEMRQLPLCSTKPAKVLPVGPSSRSRIGLQKKNLGRMPADALARSFLSKKRMHSSSQVANQSGLPLKPLTMDRLAEIIDECLQAGKHQELNDKLPKESSCAEELNKRVLSSSDECLQAGKHQELNDKLPKESSCAEELNKRVLSSSDESLQSGKHQELNDKHHIESSYAEGTKHPMVSESAVQLDIIPRNNLKRTRATEHQKVNTRKRQIIEELGQHSIKAYCSLGDGGVEDVGSDMESWSARSGDCSPPTNIRSS